MKYFVKTGAAVVLLTLSIAGSGLFPVRAESTGSGNSLVKECSVKNGTVFGEDAAGSGYNAADAAGKDDSRESGSDAAGTGTEDAKPGDDSTEGSLKNSGTVSGGDRASAMENAGGADDSGSRQKAGGTDIADGASTDAGADSRSPEGGNGENGEEEAGGRGSDGGISPYGLTVYPDDRLAQWNMGNSSGKYGNSFDTYAVFDDNVIAALYDLGNDTYRLELTGTGEMAGLGDYDYQPYKAYRKKIVSVKVGEGITNVGSGVFARFSRLEEYTLPASVKTIGKNAFEYCTSLRAVVVPDTVDSLSNYCFQHCEGAESLTIPGDLDYNAVNIPFYNMKNLKHIYITPGKTGVVSVSQVKNPTSSPANISDGYTIHIMEGVTEIHDKVFANTKASRIEIADSVTVIGTDAFAKKAYDKSTIPDYIVLGDNTRSIAPMAFMASVETITPTTVEIGNVYQYEYDWTAVRRDVAFLVRLNALKELTAMVEKDIEDGIVSQDNYPPDTWEKLQNALEAAKVLVDTGYVYENRITETFIWLYDMYHYKVTTDFIITVPAEITMVEDVENNRIIGMIPITVERSNAVGNWSIYADLSSYTMQDKLSGKTISLEEYRWEEVPWEGSADYGTSYNLWLTGERLAGDWEGTIRIPFDWSK